MKSVNKVQFKQKAVSEFLWQKMRPSQTHRCLKKVYGESTVDISMSIIGKTGFHHQKMKELYLIFHASDSSTARMMPATECTDIIIWDYEQITTMLLIVITVGSANTIMHQFFFCYGATAQIEPWPPILLTSKNPCL